MTDAAGEPDGRRLRRERNREAVLDALVELYRDGNYQPGADEIAARAGLSPRSLFRYFDDIDDLTRSAIDRALANARPLLELGVDADAPTRTKVEHLVAARANLFDATGAAGRAARACASRNAIVAAQLREGRAFLRMQVRALLAPELDGERAVRLPAVDALCSFEAYDLLRVDQGLSRPKAVAALVGALTALLEP